MFLINDILTDINSPKRISNINYILCLKDLLSYYNITTNYFSTDEYSEKLYSELLLESKEIAFIEKLLRSDYNVEIKFNTILRMLKSEIQNQEIKYVYCRSHDLDEYLSKKLNLQIYVEEKNQKQVIEINVDDYDFKSIQQILLKQENEYKLTGNNQYYGEYLRNILREKNICFYSTIDKENIKFWFDKEFDHDIKSRIDDIFDKLKFETKNINIDFIEIFNHINDFSYLTQVLEDKNEEKMIDVLQKLYENLKQNDEHFDKYFAVFVRLFYLSYDVRLYDVGIKCINLFIEKYGLDFISKYKLFVLKHFINTYEFMNQDKEIYSDLINQYVEISHNQVKEEGDFDNWLSKHSLSSDLFNFKPIFHENEIRSPNYVDSVGIDYIENRVQNLDKIKEMNLNVKWLGLTKLLYSYVRVLVNIYKWKTNNFYIEYMLEKTQNEIDKIINLDPPLHRHAGQRFSSIVSSKSLIKARYSLDNENICIKDVAKEYEKEILFIIDRDYHIANTGTYTKCVQSLGEVQSIYNMLEFYDRKSLYDVYIRQIKRFFSSIYNTDYYKKNLFLLDSKKNEMISITVNAEMSVLIHYLAAFRSAKTFKTNTSKNVQIELYNLINTFNVFRRHGKLEEEKLEIVDMYDKDFIQVY